MSIVNRTGLEGRDDFLGFTFNNRHSSDFKIVRVSNGDRYEEDLMPTSKDTTVDIPGVDGAYYIISKNQTKIFNINFAFDNVSEIEIRGMKEWLNGKTESFLIFDENPYKKYKAKVTTSPKLSWICFDIDGKRIYKGEGNVQFTCYYPYATSVFKTLNEYTGSENGRPLYYNKNEWKEVSKMKENLNGYDYLIEGGSEINLYNPGDLPANWNLIFSKQADGIQKLECKIGEDYSDIIGQLYIDTSMLSNKEVEAYMIDVKKQLLLGLDINNYKPNGKVYNYAIIGDFFKIPLGESKIVFNQSNNSIINVIPNATSDDLKKNIFYDYIYY